MYWGSSMAKKQQKLGINPWISIWVKPRETLHKIVAFNAKYRFFILSFLYGLPMLLHTAQSYSLGEKFTLFGISVVSILLATFIGMLVLTIASGLLYWTGKWIGGEADYYAVRAAASWSNVPNIVSIVMWIILMIAFGDQVFFAKFQEQNFAGSGLVLVSIAMFVQAILSIWSFIILVKGLGEVQGFSAWKGILNVLIPFFMVGVFIWLLTWIFWFFRGMSVAA